MTGTMKVLIAVLLLTASTTSCGPGSGTTGGTGGLGGTGPGWAPRIGLSPPALNKVLVGGRFASVVVHPTQPLAYAAAEAGGIYSTADQGLVWFGTNSPDGSLSSLGQGFAGTGVNEFSQMAINANGALVVLAGTGSFGYWQPANGTGGPVWRSTAASAGATFQPATNVNAGPLGPYGADGQIAFSPTSTRAYAVIGDQLGSTPPNTDGDQWTWTTPVTGMINVQGLDIFPAGNSNNPFGDGTGDILAFSTWDGTKRWLVLLDTNGNQTKTYAGSSVGAGACQVAFDPGNSFHVFMASSNGGSSQISEGIITGDTIKWTDLTQGKIGKNGRPAWVQTHAHPGDATQVDIYYHDSVNLWTMTCPVATVCPSTAMWTQIKTVHGDYSRIAFNAQGCPLYIADDGGLEVGGCSSSWGTPQSGLHALEPWNASFAQGNGTRSILLDLQDNGVFAATAQLSPSGPGTLSWVQLGGADGHWSTMDPSDPSQGLAESNCSYYELGPVPTPKTSSFALPSALTDTPLGIQTVGDDQPIEGFVAPGVLEVPALNATGQLQMWSYTMATNSVATVGTPSVQTFDNTPCMGSNNASLCLNAVTRCKLGSDFATAGGSGASSANAYLAYNKALYGFAGASGQWTQLSGGMNQPAQAYRVWGDLSGQSGDAGRFYVLDNSNNTMWFSVDGGSTQNQDMNLTTAAAGAWANALPTDPCPGHVCSVAWDTTDNQRIAVGTDHNGILFTSNGGTSWSVNSVPEPNGGVTGVSLEPNKGSSSANSLAAIWGEGVWAIALQAMVMQIQTVSGAAISGHLLDGAHSPMVGAPLALRVYGRDLLEASLTADARLRQQYDPTSYYAGTRSRVAPRLSSVGVPPNPVVFDGSAGARTGARGDFTVTMPSLPAGRYFVQVIFPGDSGNPRTIVGTDYTVTSSVQ